MKTKSLRQILNRIPFLMLACCATTLLAQVSSAARAAESTAQIVKLLHAKIGEDTIIAYIRNSGSNRGLNADQIIQ